MRIAHVAPFAPGRCGLYETVRDLVVAERLLGHRVDLVDAGVQGEGAHVGAIDWRRTGTIEARGPEAARDADVVVTHTAPPPAVLEATSAPLVHVLHGRPRSSYLIERADPAGAPVWRMLRRWGADPRYHAFVNPWPSHRDAWLCALPEDRLHGLSAPPIDLDLWSPEGDKRPWTTDHADGDSRIKVLVADVWRDDVDPLHALVALAAVAARGEAPIRVHVLGLPGPTLAPAQEAVLGRLRRHDALGETLGHMRGMDAAYRAVDVLVTPQTIDTRTVREALACGTPVVRHRERYDTYALAEELREARGRFSRDLARDLAHRFDSKAVAMEFLSILQGVL